MAIPPSLGSDLPPGAIHLGGPHLTLLPLPPNPLDDDLRSRYALLRCDGKWFKHSSNANQAEWTTDLCAAHLWVDLDACKAAAWVHWQLRLEDVLPIEIVVTSLGQRFQATYSNLK